MESGEANVDPAPIRPRAKLPPSPPLAYRAVPMAAGWVVAASFPDAKHWHAAKNALSRHGIVARMHTAQGEAPGFDLLVLETELEWARDLIMRQSDESTGRVTGGFPLDNVKSSGAIEPAHVRAIPVEERGLSREQRAKYTTLIVVLWIVLFIVVLLFVLGSFLLPNYYSTADVYSNESGISLDRFDHRVHLPVQQLRSETQRRILCRMKRNVRGKR